MLGCVKEGPTLTMALDTGSRALQIGVSSQCPATDQRGFTRPNPESTNCDAGAYESDSTPAVTPLTISPATVPDGTYNVAYSQTFTASGGDGSYTYSLLGALPTGLTFTGDTLSGTPTQMGSFPITITAQDYQLQVGLSDYTLVIDKALPTMSLTSSQNPSLFGSAVTFNASVAGYDRVSPTGTVTFQDDGVNLVGCTAIALTRGNASCSSSALTEGSHVITASYNGDANFESGSAELTQVVKTVFDITVDKISLTVKAGNTSFTYTGLVTILGEGMPLNKAAVTIQWQLPSGTVVEPPSSTTALTNRSGVAKFVFRGAVQGDYKICVTDVVKSGWNWPHDPNNYPPCSTVSITSVEILSAWLPTIRHFRQ